MPVPAGTVEQPHAQGRQEHRQREEQGAQHHRAKVVAGAGVDELLAVDGVAEGNQAAYILPSRCHQGQDEEHRRRRGQNRRRQKQGRGAQALQQVHRRVGGEQGRAAGAGHAVRVVSAAFGTNHKGPSKRKNMKFAFATIIQENPAKCNKKRPLAAICLVFPFFSRNTGNHSGHFHKNMV